MCGCGALAERDRAAAIALYEEERFAESVPRFEKALRWKPDDVETRGLYAIALTRSGDANGAIDQWFRVLKAKPDWADGRYWFGIAYLQSNRMREAVEQWVKTAELDSAHVNAHYNLGLAYLKMGLVPLATEEWSQVLLIDPTHYEARGNRGRMRIVQGDVTGGLEDFLIANAVRPEVTMNWLLLGETYFLNHDSAHAVASIDSFFGRGGDQHPLAERARSLRARIVAGETPPAVLETPLGSPPVQIGDSVEAFLRAPDPSPVPE